MHTGLRVITGLRGISRQADKLQTAPTSQHLRITHRPYPPLALPNQLLTGYTSNKYNSTLLGDHFPENETVT